MPFRVILPKPVLKIIDLFETDQRRFIIKKIGTLTDNPYQIGTKKLKGYNDQYRIRAGDYRIRFQINQKQSEVITSSISPSNDLTIESNFSLS